jgi:enoyl-CoA hydratase/3-hydroxyacyl-CoA dehydrogenase
MDLPPLPIPDAPMAAGQLLSREAVAITVKTVQAAAAAAKLKDALEIGYRGFGEIACTAAAREGISAFLEKRRPVFEK